MHEQLLNLREKRFAEVGEGIVVRMQPARDKAKRNALISVAFHLARTEHPSGIAIEQQAQQDFGRKGNAADGSIAGVNPAQVELRDHIDDKACQVIQWQGVAQSNG